jgi:hypothetical protein
MNSNQLRKTLVIAAMCVAIFTTRAGAIVDTSTGGPGPLNTLWNTVGWITSDGELNRDGGLGIGLETGTVIQAPSLPQSQVILTAAHGVAPSSLYHRFELPANRDGTGSYDSYYGLAITHPKYGVNNDVAVLLLESPTPVAGERISPDFDLPFFSTVRVTVVGGGPHNEGGTRVPEQQRRLRTGTLVANDFRLPFTINDEYNFRPAPELTQPGDSGGPVFYNGSDGTEIVGIVKEGARFVNASALTLVDGDSGHRDWIMGSQIFSIEAGTTRDLPNAWRSGELRQTDVLNTYGSFRVGGWINCALTSDYYNSDQLMVPLWQVNQFLDRSSDLDTIEVNGWLNNSYATLSLRSECYGPGMSPVANPDNADQQLQLASPLSSGGPLTAAGVPLLLKVSGAGTLNGVNGIIDVWNGGGFSTNRLHNRGSIDVWQTESGAFDERPGYTCADFAGYSVCSPVVDIEQDLFNDAPGRIQIQVFSQPSLQGKGDRVPKVVVGRDLVSIGTIEVGTEGVLSVDGTMTVSGRDMDLRPAPGSVINDGVVFASQIIVRDGGRLSGKGSYNGASVIDSQGGVAPGGSAGTLTINGPVSFESESYYAWELSSATGMAGQFVGWDLLRVSGPMVIGATPERPLKLNLATLAPDGKSTGLATGFDASQPWRFVIATATGGIDEFSQDAIRFDTSHFQNDLGRGVFSVAVDGSEVILVFTPDSAPLGDVDHDGRVTRADFARFSRTFGKASGATWSDGDFDGDGQVTLRDLSTLQAAIQQLSPTVAAIPEPSSFAILVIGIGLIGTLKRARLLRRTAIASQFDGEC